MTALPHQPFWIPENAPPDSFPAVEQALNEPNGLLAIGGDLSAERLFYAYRHGIFPWFSDGQPILWWSPDPRAVLFPDEMHISRSLRKTLRNGAHSVTVNQAFTEVIDGCAAPRAADDGTWITGSMRAAYMALHRKGRAHSVECWRDGELAGGLYGVVIGTVFFGESMFSRLRDGSKVALAHLCSLGFDLIDCQLPNPHLQRLGASEIPRQEYIALLDRYCLGTTPALAHAPEAEV